MDDNVSGQEIENSEEEMRLCCPVCGRSEFYYEAGMKLGRLYHCKHCGYIGTFVISANQKMMQLIRDEYESKLRAFEQRRHNFPR